MNLNAIENSKQEDHASNGRRGFMKRLGATLGAGLATGAVAIAPTIGQAEAHPFLVTPTDSAELLQGYNRHMLTHLCETAGMLSEWYRVNKERIQGAVPELDFDLEDLVFEASEAARSVAKASGIEANWDYVAKRGVLYALKSARGAA